MFEGVAVRYAQAHETELLYDELALLSCFIETARVFGCTVLAWFAAPSGRAGVSHRHRL